MIDYVLGCVETVTAVRCEDFDNLFSDVKKQDVFFKGSKQFAIYDSLFSYFADNEDKVINGIDVRMEIKTYCNEKVLRTICVGYNGDTFYFLNTGKYKSNLPLWAYLKVNFWNRPYFISTN